jgi:hypothetical protein
MLPVKTLAIACRKGGKLMKLALVSGLSGLAMIVGVTAALAQANINPNIYPPYRGAPVAQQPWEWHAGPGPNKRGAMCVKHTDTTRGYGYHEACPPPKKAAKK